MVWVIVAGGPSPAVSLGNSGAPYILLFKVVMVMLTPPRFLWGSGKIRNVRSVAGRAEGT